MGDTRPQTAPRPLQPHGDPHPRLLENDHSSVLPGGVAPGEPHVCHHWVWHLLESCGTDARPPPNPLPLVWTQTALREPGQGMGFCDQKAIRWLRSGH